MLTAFLDKKMQTARYKLLKDGTYFGEIPTLKGVWADSKNLEACRTLLKEVLEDWLYLQIRSGENISELKIQPMRRVLAKHA